MRERLALFSSSFSSPWVAALEQKRGRGEDAYFDISGEKMYTTRTNGRLCRRMSAGNGGDRGGGGDAAEGSGGEGDDIKRGGGRGRGMGREGTRASRRAMAPA